MNVLRKWLVNLFLLHCPILITSLNKGGDELSCATNPNEDDHVVSYQWIPEAEHPCNIQKFPITNFTSTFGLLPPLHHEPIIIQTNDRNKIFRRLTSSEGIVASFPPNFNITLSSSNSFSEHRRSIPLVQYLEEIQKTETVPDALSNETWYFFGENHSKEWKDLLQNYKLPPCQTCNNELVALSFGIGNRGSGVQWHVHGPGFAEALWGRKHWILYPENQKPEFHPDYTSRHWMEYTYKTLDQKSLPFECTLEPGDIIYFPTEWWHATINLDPYTSFVSTFTTEHDYFLDLNSRKKQKTFQFR